MSTVIGMDVHKDTLALAAVDSAGRQQAAATFDNTDDGHEKLMAWVHEFGDVTRLGMESSGGVARRLAHRLGAAGYVVVEVQPRLSSRETKRLRTRGKSDPTDALAVARVVLREPDLPVVRSEGAHEDLKLLVDYRSSSGTKELGQRTGFTPISRSFAPDTSDQSDEASRLVARCAKRPSSSRRTTASEPTSPVAE